MAFLPQRTRIYSLHLSGVRSALCMNGTDLRSIHLIHEFMMLLPKFTHPLKNEFKKLKGACAVCLKGILQWVARKL